MTSSRSGCPFAGALELRTSLQLTVGVYAPATNVVPQNIDS